MKLNLAALLVVCSFVAQAQPVLYTQAMHDHQLKVVVQEMDASGITEKLAQLSGKSNAKVRAIMTHSMDRCLGIYINKDTSNMSDEIDDRLDQCTNRELRKGFGVSEETLAQWQQVLDSDDSLQTPEEKEIAALEAQMEAIMDKEEPSEQDMAQMQALQKKQTELMVKMAQKYQVPE